MVTRVIRGNVAVIVVLAIGVGMALGMAVGWRFPVQRFTASFDGLHPDFKADYTVMVGNAYALNGDWPTAEARLAVLMVEPDLATYMADLTERYIAEGRNVEDIRSLVGLSLTLDSVTPAMEPYLLPQMPDSQGG